MKCVPTTAALMTGAAILLFAAPAFALPPNTSAHETVQHLPPGGAGSGTCVETAANYAVSTDLQKTASKKFRDVSGASVAFTQGTAGCVEVSFSSEAATTSGELLVTQVLLDGNACMPSDNNFASDSPSNDLADHAMNYICTGVSSGSHTAKVQFRSRFGGQVALDFRTTIVRYAQ